MNEIQQARVDTIVELSNALLRTTADSIKLHGDDPELDSVLTSAYTLTIRQLNNIAPGFREFMIHMLEADIND